MSSLFGKEIVRLRGDTSADVIVERDATTGLPRDVTGFTYLLTVNSLKNPPDDTTQVTQIVGTLSDPTNGVVHFTWSSNAADQAPGTYWYDIQRTDTLGRITTLAKNKYIFRQDITKN